VALPAAAWTPDNRPGDGEEMVVVLAGNSFRKWIFRVTGLKTPKGPRKGPFSCYARYERGSLIAYNTPRVNRFFYFFKQLQIVMTHKSILDHAL
jgi:hypothetical protein